MNEKRATSGHNRPSETPFDQVVTRIENLHLEAQNWLDGEGVADQAQADMVSKLLDDARKAKKEADELRKAESKPFDDGKAEVQARYKPLLGKADLIADLCKKVLAPFLDAQERAKREAEAKARAAAEAKAEAARKAHEAAKDSTDIAEREKAEAAIAEAKEAERAAARAGKDKGHAKGGSRVVGLRIYYAAEVTDMQTFARYVWEHHQAELREFLDGLAKRLAHEQPMQTLPGVTVHEQKRAV